MPMLPRVHFHKLDFDICNKTLDMLCLSVKKKRKKSFPPAVQLPCIEVKTKIIKVLSLDPAPATFGWDSSTRCMLSSSRLFSVLMFV